MRDIALYVRLEGAVDENYGEFDHTEGDRGHDRQDEAFDGRNRK